jgi:hypothetical protein
VLAACQFPQSGRTSIVPRLGDGVPGRDLDGLLQAAALDDVEPADRLPGLGERTVGDERLPVADTHGRGAASQLVAGDPVAPCLDVVQPGEALSSGSTFPHPGCVSNLVPAAMYGQIHRRRSKGIL